MVSCTFIVAKASVKIVGNRLDAELYGDDVLHYSLDHVKAVTYSDMYVKKLVNEWELQVVLDV